MHPFVALGEKKHSEYQLLFDTMPLPYQEIGFRHFNTL